MKKYLKVLFVFAVIATSGISAIESKAACNFENWVEVDASTYLAGGQFILVCPANGVRKCCIAKSEGLEP